MTTAYDALNRPTTLKELDTASLASYAYDDLGRRTTVTLGNGTSTTYSYDANASLNALAHNLAGTAHDQSYSYTRNQAREIATHSWSNDLYQWAGVAGNATNGTRSYTANGLNQYTAAAGAAVTHDTNGNLTGDGTWTYGYDQNNRLRTATKTGTSAALAYDAEGRLRQSVVTAGTAATLNKAYDGVDLVAEYDATGTLQSRWVHGPGIDEPLVAYEGATTASKSWLYADHLGSIVATADTTGTNTAVYSYGPYGEPNTAAGQRFRYTGQQLIGGLDLYYYKARFYDPKLGRFLQTDPIGTADDMNLYAYVGNNPVNRTDPTGLSAKQSVQLACGGPMSCNQALADAFRLAGTAGAAAGGTRYDPEQDRVVTPDGRFVTQGPVAPIVTPPFVVDIIRGVMSYGAGLVYSTGADKPGEAKPEDGNREKDVPNRGEPGEVKEGERRTREYGPDGKPVRDYDKPHQGYDSPHVHEWPGGKREHPGRDYSPWPRK